MRCFAFATDFFMDEAQPCQQVKTFLRFKNNVECREELDDNDTDNSNENGNNYLVERFRKLEGPYYKKTTSNFRLILTSRDLTINSQTFRCYVALRCLKRGCSDYKNFISTNFREQDRKIITKIDDVDWGKYEEEIRAKLIQQPVIQPLPDLSSEEYAFLQRDKGLTQEIFEDPVFESKQWVDRKIARPSELAKKLYEIILLREKQLCLEMVPVGNANLNILYYHHVVGGQDSWYLLDFGEKEDIDREYWEKLIDPIRTDPEELTKVLQKQCRRGYPATLLEDDDSWREMEQNENSNFILSGEEIDVITKKLDFPLFISGRAGSGKSTVLQYLFAEFMLKYLENPGIKEPVYISYSNSLIENAQKLSKTLFETSHVYIDALNELQETLGTSFKKDIEPKYKDGHFFFVFQDLVKDCIAKTNPDVLQKRFNDSNYISYTKFRHLWMEKFGKDGKVIKKHNPGTSWHVIRSYIKGWDSEAYLEDYSRIGERDRTVTDETFKFIFDNVWTWYKQIQDENGYWDDQDLVRYCLSPDDDSCLTYVQERFSAIFCDEAQDFTRVESEFIIQLSSFAHRNYDKNNEQYLDHLPFVFAGDEFQTLNPTGFSWSSLRSGFRDCLLKALRRSPNDRYSIPEPQKLTMNYRSTEPIVRLGNRLQLLRQTRCVSNDKSDKEIPQNSYFSEKGAPVYCLPPDKQDVWDCLRQLNCVLIIPAADGQSPKDFIEQSPVKGLIDFYEDGSPQNITICNPVQAKGLEYDCVAIYGFDDTETNSDLKIDELKRWFAKPQDSQNSKNDIEVKYQLSNAYVAVTRAKKQLFIISNFDKSSFWAFAFATPSDDLKRKVDDVQQAMLERAKKISNLWHKDSLGYIVEGSLDTIVTEGEVVDRKEIAQKIEERGKNMADSSLIRQAACRYREGNMEKEALHCDALAYYYDSSFMQAGDAFVIVLKKERDYRKRKVFEDFAVTSYWSAYADGDDNALIKILDQLNDSNRTEVLFAKCAQQKTIGAKRFDEVTKGLKHLLEDLKNPDLVKLVLQHRKAWERCINKIFSLINDISKSDFDFICEAVQFLKKNGMELDEKTLCKLAIQCKNYQWVVDLYNQSDDPSFQEEYHLAQAHLLSYPQNLEHWVQSGCKEYREEIVKLWKRNPDRQLEDKYECIVGKALLSLEETDDKKDERIKDAQKFLHSMLANAKSADESLGILLRFKDVLNCEAIKALIHVQWNKLEKYPNLNSQTSPDPQINELFKVIRKLAEIPSREMNKKMERAFNAKHPIYVKDFMEEEFKDFLRSPWNMLLFTEMGVRMEQRGFFIDSVRYYDWVLCQAPSSTYRTEFTKRRIICRKLQGEREDSDEYRNEALDKCRELGIDIQSIPVQPPHFSHWKEYYKEIISFSRLNTPSFSHMPAAPHLQTSLHMPTPASAPVRTPAPAPAAAPEPAPAPVTAPAPEATKRQTQKVAFTIMGYDIVILPSKFELVIKYSSDSEELSIKFSGGKATSETDFTLKEERMCKTADGSKTPFKIQLSEKNVVISLLENDAETGVQFTINK